METHAFRLHTPDQRSGGPKAISYQLEVAEPDVVEIKVTLRSDQELRALRHLAGA
jgi:hypothetical protein